ncbi:MAG: hypothetical protein C0592_06695 [Marinilabiliales bacterium]|nr:MAG: hypothetical protein C0592_06695 [Marinilabiliales bacterium]
MSNKKNRNTLFSLILILTGLFLLIPSLFAFPAADDYCYALMHNRYGFFMKEEYMMTNGRWASALFLQPMYLFVENTWAYRIMPLVWLSLTTLSFYTFLKSFRIHIYGTKKIQIAIFLSLLFFFFSPSLSESLFWLTGTINYTLPVILLLFAWSILKNSIRNRNMALIVVSYFMLFLSAGFNEVVLFVVPAATWWFFRKETKGLTIITTLILLGNAAIFWYSPGNTHRATEFTHNIFSIQNIFGMAMQFLRFSMIFLFLNPFVWLLFFKYYKHEKKRELFPRFIFPLIALVPAVVLPYIGTGMLGQHRTINIALFVFLILLMYQNRDVLKKTSFKVSRILILIVFSLFISQNGFRIAEDFYKYRFHTFKKIMNSSLKSLENGNGIEISYGEKVPFALKNQYPVQGWNEKNIYCGEVYFLERQK